MFENRTFDNLLGRLYQPGEVLSFEGVIGKDLCRIWLGLVTTPPDNHGRCRRSRYGLV